MIFVSYNRGHLRQAGFINDKSDASSSTQHSENCQEEAPSISLDIEGADEYGDDDDSDHDADSHAVPLKATSSEVTGSTEITASNAVVRCVVYSGLAPQLVRICRIIEDDSGSSKKGKGKGKGKRGRHKGNSVGKEKLCVFQSDGREVFIDRSSLTHRLIPSLMGDRYCGVNEAFVTYHKKMGKARGITTTGSGNAENRIYIEDCSAIDPVGVLLFSCAGAITLSKTRKKVEINGWIRFRISELHAVLLKRLQAEVWALLRLRVEEPLRDIRQRQALLLRVVELLLLTPAAS